LCDVATKIGSGVTPKGGSEVYIENQVPFIRSQNVLNDKLVLDGVCIDEKTHNKMKNSWVKPNDILLNITGGSLGRSCLIPTTIIKANVNQHVCIIRLKKEYAPKYFQSLIASHKGQTQLIRSQTGSGREGLNFQSLKMFKLYAPKFDEQQKIAAFLSAVDKKIELLTKKKELLEQYKKGVMQQIFTQKIHFKDQNGNPYPTWQTKRLGEVCEYISTNSLSRNDLNYESGNILNIHYGDIHTKLKSLFEANDNILPFINAEKEDVLSSPTQFCKEGDLIIADASEDLLDIGKSIEIIDIKRKKIVAGLHTVVLRDINSNFEVGFKSLLFSTQNIREQIQKNAQGISVLGISKKAISRLKIQLPDKVEQRIIVDFVSKIIRQIDDIQSLINSTSTFKKSLLQKMLV